MEAKPSVSEREEKVRKTDQFISKIIELWPVWGLLAAGTVSSITFWNKVNDLWSEQKAWKGNIEQRREVARNEDAKRDDRLTRLEKDVEWLKALRGKP